MRAHRANPAHPALQHSSEYSSEVYQPRVQTHPEQLRTHKVVAVTAITSCSDRSPDSRATESCVRSAFSTACSIFTSLPEGSLAGVKHQCRQVFAPPPDAPPGRRGRVRLPRGGRRNLDRGLTPLRERQCAQLSRSRRPSTLETISILQSLRIECTIRSGKLHPRANALTVAPSQRRFIRKAQSVCDVLRCWTWVWNLRGRNGDTGGSISRAKLRPPPVTIAVCPRNSSA